ncbi:hypothetical protein NGRA_0914 [Nosema granulosis]|uniref:Uncharacterized protein n=1 Tax=Nosema granulosis TaxID=83296 RepID=A0A9P6H017_9MICR|nr:hypothetical protein NGRA_0914 [Nosema granulosis]
MKNNNLHFENTHPIYTNISLQFTGIGHLVVYGNALISYIEKKYNLKISNLPLYTYKHAFWFMLSNLKTAGFDVITIFYEEETDIHRRVVLKYLKSLYAHRHISEFNKYIKNERVALVMGDLSENSREFLYQCLSRNMYISLMDSLEFRIPFVYSFVYAPLPICNNQEIELHERDEEEFMSEEAEEFINEEELDSKDFIDFDGEVSEETCLSLLKKKKNNFDGRKLHKREIPEEELSKLNIQNAETKSQNIKALKPEAMELDLLVNFKQINTNSSMIHLKNIQRSAMSLFNGELLFAPIIRNKETTKPRKISKKQMAIIEESEKRIKAKEAEQDKLWLKNFYLKYTKANKEGKKLLLETTKPTKANLYKRILLLKIEYYADIWKLELHSEDCDERLLIPCYSSCIEFVNKYVEEGGPHLEFVLQTLIDCGFEATVHEILEKNSIDDLKNLKFYTEDTSAPSDYDICFQLKYMGDKLKRSLGSRKDKRVLFEPDRWQIKLLDLVDQNKSAVVAAPTSSGKTFICFYAIEKILRESDDAMVIFCLPTKALANQVSADIYARFSPKLNCKTNIQGFLMKDNSNDPFNCQVLITIPSLLESILNSPPPKGLDKIKYIIIDEVHKISSEEMGSPIERIFHLSPCPMLVLSATLGNLEGFFGWMKSIENSKGRECELVVHNERYCELKPYVYSSNKVTPISNLFAYSYEHIRKFGFGNDINFLPEELLELFDTLCKVLSEEQKELLYPLVPENFFKSNILTKKDCKEYEKHLLGYFQGLIKEDLVSEKQIKAVYRLLTRESRKAFEKVEACDEEYIAENILSLLNNLKEDNMLPCIVFNTDRDFVSRLAIRVYQKLEALDKDVKKNKAIDKIKKEAKRNRDAEKGKDSWIEDSLIAERDFELKDDKKNIKYTFLDPATKITDYELEEETKYIKNTAPEFLDMMYRGIGVHHEQMNRRYRNVAEILFRKKHIRVLFATDTLALGINMPCRSVVFAGDTLLLDPLNYKQMAGRAGRRGFDTLGNVIFLGIPQKRVQNLMVSRLPNIKGVYTYTNSSFVGFNIKDSLIKHPLLESTFYTDTTTDSSNYDLHDIFLSIKQRESLVNLQIDILAPYFNSTSFLNELIISNRETDPSIFIFVLLLQSGLLSYEPTAFMTTLAHIFEIRPLLFQSTVHALPPLEKNLYQFCMNLNTSCIKTISNFYSPVLQHLQSRSKEPLHKILSFLYADHLDSPKNSYLLDFFKHSNVKRIREENNVRSADLFKSLSVINTVFTSLIRWYLKYDLDKDILKKIQGVYAIFEPKFKSIFA